MIGVSVIFTGAIIAILSIAKGHTKWKRNMLLLGITATLIIVLTDVTKNSLRPIWVDAYASSSYLKGITLGFLIGDTFPFFPFAGYALYGAMFGLAFYLKLEKKQVLPFSFSLGSIYLVIGLVFLRIRGHPEIIHAHETPPIQWNFTQLGIMLILGSFMYILHFSTRFVPKKRVINSKIVRRLGMMTLTIFIMEPVLGTAIKVLILDPLFPGWSSNGPLSFIYGFSLLILWIVLLKLWEQINFAGSFEWMSVKVLGTIRQNKSSQLKTREHLNQTIPQTQKSLDS
jgi:hypothetical protein